jgi:polysaccharide export outer membrane protein
MKATMGVRRTAGVARLDVTMTVALFAMAGCASGGPELVPMEAPPVAAPEVRGPVLRAGDIVGIDVWRQDELSGEFTVNIEGTLDHPLYRELTVAGVPLETVEQRVGAFLLPYVTEPSFAVRPQYRVTVGGEVRQPGVLFLPPGTTIADAITEGGGPTADAGDGLELYRGGRGFTLDLRDPTAPVLSNTVQSGDRLVVLRASSFSVWGDLFVPLLSAASITLQLIRLSR